jgi:hypothetical protein
MRFPALVLIVLLTGCSEIPTPAWMSDITGGNKNSSNSGTPSNATNVAAPSDDLGSCQEQADAMIKRDLAIDQDINNQNTNSDLVQGAGDLNNNLAYYNTKNRYNRIVENCMAARGYDTQNPSVKPVQQEGASVPAPASAPSSDQAPEPPSGLNPNLPTYP